MTIIMNNTEQVLLELIKSSLFGFAPNIPTDTDWNAVLGEARVQAVVGIAAQAVPPEYRDDWTQDEYEIIANYTRYSYAEEELLQLFSAEHIPVAILKGDAAIVYYPLPVRRMVGDIDLIVPQEWFQRAQQVLEENGYVPHINVDLEREKQDIRHIGYDKNGVMIELHHHFSSANVDIEKYITEGLRHIETGVIEGRTFPMLPKLANGMVLLAHMDSHLHSGLGLRQIIDWLMYVNRELDDAFWEESFSAAASDVGLETLAVVVTRMCQKYLGLKDSITWCRSADEAVCDTLMEQLLSFGNFGQKEGADRSIVTVITLFRKEGLFRYIQKAGEHNWEAYHKHTWLKPLCGFYQFCRYLRRGLKLGRGRGMANRMRRSKEIYDLLENLGRG